MTEQAPPLAGLLEEGTLSRALLLGAFGNSPFLTRLAVNKPRFLAGLFSSSPEAVFCQICRRALAAGYMETHEQAALRLREVKGEAALLIALADLGGVWSLAQTYRAWSRFADAALRGAVNFLTRTTKNAPALSVLAMGKYGARELNYSSDIDLILLYEREQDEKGEIANRMARDLVALMARADAAGYVFRTDLRLRPDPAVTPPAVPISGALAYYESFGQHWERAIFIRARAAAGDRKAGQEFLNQIQPFIWRKYIDYAVAQDMHSMKRQIHADSNRRTPAEGRDIKRGPGGIREIEFFVQTQQLILGGRDLALRRSDTVGMLARLKARGWIDAQCARDMIEAYRFWRTLEHRLQMVEDAQTHHLPANAEGVAHIACFMGMENADALKEAIEYHAARVDAHYEGLFADAPSLAAGEGNLVFTGNEDDPATLENLAGMGFAEPAMIASTVRSWHSGRLRAVRSARSREELTLLVPALLQALAKTGEPDGAFARFANFLQTLPAGVQFFALLRAHPTLLDLIALICRAAPNLAQTLAHYPAQLEILMAKGRSDRVGALRHLERDLAGVPDYEASLDVARRWAREQRFATSTAMLGGALTPERAARNYAFTAQAAIRALLPLVQAETHAVGQKRGDAAVLVPIVVAMGSLGGKDMSAVSDVDLVVLYETPEKEGAAMQAATRLAHGFVAALNAPTAQGKLYEVDMRLRPSGGAGPVAVEMGAFRQYHAEQAWVWEHLALTRARPIAGPAPLRRRAAALIREILCRPRDRQETADAVRDMRARLQEAHPLAGAEEFSLRHLRYAAGGLVDIDFITQFLQLIHAAEHPQILQTSTPDALTQMRRAGLIEKSAAELLLEAHRLGQTGEQFGRLCLDDRLKGGMNAEYMEVLLRAVGMEHGSQFSARLQELQSEIRALFIKWIGQPERQKKT